MSLFPKKPKRRYHLSKTGRAALIASARKNRPWEHSTGPRSFDGKLVSRNNAVKHGYYCRHAVLPDTAAFRAFMKSLRREGSRAAKNPIGPPIFVDE